MRDSEFTRGSWLAIGLAIVGSLAVFLNETVSYRRSGEIDWVHIVLAFAAPFIVFALVGRASKGQH